MVNTDPREAVESWLSQPRFGQPTHRLFMLLNEIVKARLGGPRATEQNFPRELHRTGFVEAAALKLYARVEAMKVLME